MSEINLTGGNYSSTDLIAAIQQSNDADHQTLANLAARLVELEGVAQAILHRLTVLEDRLPVTHNGFGVLSTAGTNQTTHKVQMLNEAGKTVIVTFEVPH